MSEGKGQGGDSFCFVFFCGKILHLKQATHQIGEGFGWVGFFEHGRRWAWGWDLAISRGKYELTNAVAFICFVRSMSAVHPIALCFCSVLSYLLLCVCCLFP